MSASGPVRRAKDGGKNDWRTPPELFHLLDREFRFTLDAAASEENALCPKFFTEEDDAFEQYVEAERVWCNPPFGKLRPWIDLFNSWDDWAEVIVALLPAATDTEWFAEVAATATEVRLLSGRVKFINPLTGKPDGSNTTGSVVAIWDHSPRPQTCFAWNWRCEL